MKKLLPAFVTLLAVTAGGAGLYLAQKNGNLHLGGDKLTVANYLPAETLAVAALPDPGKSLAGWRTTDLYKIWTEPQVQAFFAKPLSKVPANPAWDGALANIVALDPKNLFVALTALDEKENHPHLVAGFQFKGSKDDVERALAGPKKQVRDGAPAGKADLIQYQGRAIETFDAGGTNTLASTYLGDWYLISNDLALLKATVERVDHHAPETSPSLEQDADFQAVGAKLPSSYETMIFVRAQSFLNRMYALATASGQPVDPEKRAEMDKIKAVGATSSIEDGKIRDVLYTLAPGLKQDGGHLSMGSLPLSSPDTLFYLANVIRWPAKLNFPAGGSNGPAAGAMEELQNFVASLGERGITADTLRASFGNEGALQLDWSAASLQPSILASVEVRDHDAAQKLVAELTSRPVDDLFWQTTQANGQTYYSLSLANLSMVQPTLTLTGKHLLFGLDAPQVRDAAGREGSTAPTFTASDSYKTAAALVGKPNVSFAYLDTKGLFERIYGLIRPYALMGAAFLPPQYTDYVDLAKLPDTETISKHLTPSVLSQTLDKDGTKLDSVGSITPAQEITGIGIVAGVATVFYNRQVASLTGAGANRPAVNARRTPQVGATPAGVASPTLKPEADRGNNP